MTAKRTLLMTAILALVLAPFSSLALSGVYFKTEHLPEAMAGVYYSTRVEVYGENIPYEITLTQNPVGGNNFPGGMAITKEGVIYGTPPAAGVYPFSLQVAFEPDTQRFCVLELVVKPFSEEALEQGGTNAKVLGLGEDSLTGVANGINGGRSTMRETWGTVFFINSQKKLCSIDKPYVSASEMFSAPAYRWLDCIGDNLYYYQHYDTITRICRDPIFRKGRTTLTELSVDDILDLAVTNEVILYIQGKESGVLKRLPLEGGKAASLRCYYGGREILPDKAFPYNGYAYLRDAKDGALYRVWLDGEVAEKLTDVKTGAFTISRSGGEDFLCFTTTAGELFKTALSGGDAEPFGNIRAGALNSDSETIYYANTGDGNRLYGVSAQNPDQPEKLTDFAVDQIYVFRDKLVVQKKGGTELYLLAKGSDEPPIRIGK